MPLAGAFAEPGNIEAQVKIPLRLMWCERCMLLQTGERVNRDAIFLGYSYRSSAAPPLVHHFEELANFIVRLDNNAITPQLVVDIGCNDGVLLRPLMARGMNVYGIELFDDRHSNPPWIGLWHVAVFCGLGVQPGLRDDGDN